ncbi:MAG TPA: formate dehydrogenase [Burkholderiaceae bacterium]|nr:formate dehydrogenase [Burkholderiaceae bacterium]
MSQPSSKPLSKMSRRNLFAGAGTVGAAAAAVSLIPAVRDVSAPAAQPKEPPARGGGYSLTEHVKQYYKTTLV